MTGRCLSTYAELPEEGYSAGALARLSDQRQFPVRLSFARSDVLELRSRTVRRMSISGVQDKLSMRLERGGRLVPTDVDGQYILKPVPSADMKMKQDVPANESLTMQLAQRVFRLGAAVNSLIRLSDGEFAYITRRFDRRRDGSKIAQEDFCQLMGRARPTHGDDYKYDASYEQLAEVLRKACPSYAVESEKLFRRLLFDYLIGNADSHLKNFSLQQTERGDYVLTPCYDLLCTRIHFPSEWRLALDLFTDEPTRGQQTHGFVTGSDFLELADRFGLQPKRALRFLVDTLSHESETADLVARSFLSDEAKAAYLGEVSEGRRLLSVGD